MDPLRARRAALGRGFAVGTAATVLAALSHGIGGGPLPGPLAIAAGSIFGGALGTVALSRRISTLRLGAAVAGTQLAFNLGFSLLGSGGSASIETSGSGHHSAVIAITAGAPTSLGGPNMWLAHAVAGLITFALLRGMDRALAVAIRARARMVLRLARGIVVEPHPTPRALVPVPEPSARPVRLILASARALRGPPPLSSLPS